MVVWGFVLTYTPCLGSGPPPPIVCFEGEGWFFGEEMKKRPWVDEVRIGGRWGCRWVECRFDLKSRS